jgi:hypothetical protein
MLTVALSLLFGLIAVAVLAQIYVSVSTGLRRGRQILAELSAGEDVRARPLRPAHPLGRPAFARA